MPQTSGALETCARGLGTCIHSRSRRHARLFFILEARDHKTRDSVGAHLSQKVRSRAIVHMTVPEPTLVERRGAELQDTW
jgi:hypothetical protein